MVPRTRRHLLRSVTAAAVALAGCSGTASHERSVPRRDPPENVETDPESYTLRRTGETPPAWVVRDDGDASGSPATTEAATPRENARQRALLASERDAARVRFADVPGAADARAFVDETAFDRETLYLETNSVRECYRLELCYVTWSETDIETRYGSHYRSADTRCRVDARDSTAWLIRVPDALDPDAVTSHGSGWSSRGCQRPPWRRDTEGRRTPVPANPLHTENATRERGDR